MVEISTSLLSVEKDKIIKTIYNLETAKTDYFHIDVMDGKFVSQKGLTIKEVIDVWYKNNLNTNYGKYISTTAAYCNDRNVIDGTYNTSSFSYAGRTRLYSNKTPSINVEEMVQVGYLKALRR